MQFLLFNFVSMKKLCIYIILFLLSVPSFSQVQVITQHNNNYRTGWNDKETVLNKGNVKPGSFGLLFTRSVDDQIYAQPLLAKVDISGIGERNVVFVGTVNNTVYAFDADSSAIGNPYWQVNLTPAGQRVMKNTDTACGNGYEDFSGNLGLVGTPVIDTVANTLYVVAKSVLQSGGNTSYQQYLHALDLRTGDEKPHSPVLITAQVNGSGSGSSGGVIHFDAQLENQRSGLLLSNGIVYIAWAAHGDCGDYHGWIIGYDKTSLQQKYVYNATPEGYQGGIWMSGGGPSADDSGYIYASVGNGAVGNSGDPSDPANRSESALKLLPDGGNLTLTDFFTPLDYPVLENGDEDFGVTGMLLLPGRNQAFSGAKDGNIYLMDLNSMGGYNASANNVVQTFSQNSNDAHNLSSLTYYKGTGGEFVYIWSDNVPLAALPYDSSIQKFDLTNVIKSSIPGPVGYNGAFLSVSSDYSIDSTAILWASHAADNCNANNQTCPGILRAIDANDVNKELWNSSMSSRDDPGNYAKFNCPTIANGKVYLATFSDRLDVYGLTNGSVTGLYPEGRMNVNIYPNPVKNLLHIESGEGPLTRLLLFNLNGEIVLRNEDPEKSNIIVPLGQFPAGMYIIEIQINHKRIRQKLLINR